METSINPNAKTAAISQSENGEFRRLAQIIVDAVEVEKIICFGSVCHHVVTKNCFGDLPAECNVKRNSYSLLVIPSANRPLAQSIVQRQVEEACAPVAEVTAIVHTMEEVNAALRCGSGFFTAVCSKGILIHDNGTSPFAAPDADAPVSKRSMRREEFWNKWHGLAQGFLQGAVFFHNNGLLRLAVYLLHQAVQHCYCGVLRVTVGYRTNAQNLNRLIRLIDTSAPNLSRAPPRHPAEDMRVADVLCTGYSAARERGRLEVSEEQVAGLITRVSQIVNTADRTCRLRLQQLKDGKAAPATE